MPRTSSALALFALAVAPLGAAAQTEVPFELCVIDEPSAVPIVTPEQALAGCKPASDAERAAVAVRDGNALGRGRYHLFVSPNRDETTFEWTGGADCQGEILLAPYLGTEFEFQPAGTHRLGPGKPTTMKQTIGLPPAKYPKNYFLASCVTGPISTDFFRVTYMTDEDLARVARETEAAKQREAEAERAKCFGQPDAPIFAPGAAWTAAGALEAAKKAMAQGNPVRAMEAVEAGLTAAPQDPDINLLGSALLHDVRPERAEVMAKAAAVTLPPFPTIPPQAPAKVGKKAWVNVASAGLRQTPSDQGNLLGRLPIGTQVKVLKAAGDFFHISVARADIRAKGGFVHKDLLSAAAPTVASILAEADRLEAAGPDSEAMMLWRAVNLAPNRADVLDRLVGVALAGRRYGLALDGINVAIRAGRWPVDAQQTAFRTLEAARLHLYRAAITADAAAMRALLAPLKHTVQITNDDAKEVPLAGWYARAMSTSSSEFWLALKRSALVGMRGGPHWYDSAVQGTSLVLEYRCNGWALTQFDAPGGYDPEECINGCNKSEGDESEGDDLVGEEPEGGGE